VVEWRVGERHGVLIEAMQWNGGFSQIRGHHGGGGMIWRAVE